MVKQWLGGSSMLAGALLENNELSKEVLVNAVWKLAGGIEMRGQNLTGTFVLVCRPEMFEMLIGHWPELKGTPWQQIGDLDFDDKDAIMGVVSGDPDFPKHYVVLTDLAKLEEFVRGGAAPYSALIAVKGFSPEETGPKQAHEALMGEYSGKKMLRHIGAHEFYQEERNAPKLVRVHSDYSAMMLMNAGLVKNGLLFGKLPLEMDYDREKRTQVDVIFEDGLILTFHEGSIPQGLTSYKETSGDFSAEDVANGGFGR